MSFVDSQFGTTVDDKMANFIFSFFIAGHGITNLSIKVLRVALPTALYLVILY